jgi:hypothetical protein
MLASMQQPRAVFPNEPLKRIFILVGPSRTVVERVYEFTGTIRYGYDIHESVSLVFGHNRVVGITTGYEGLHLGTDSAPLDTYHTSAFQPRAYGESTRKR